MASKDIAARVKHVQSLRPQATTATRTGTGVDTLGYEGVLIVVNAGLRTDGTHTTDIEESDDDSTYTDVAAADLQGTEPVINSATTDEQDYEVGYIGSKRYVRVNIAVSGATTGAVLGASVMLAHAKALPA